MESEFIDWLRGRLGEHVNLKVGPGDDAAVVALGGRSDVVVTVDLLTDGVDFVLREIDARRAGHKALGASLSDLAAMAAKPLAAVVALALPRRGALELATALYEGMIPLAQRFDLAIAGGDTNTWDGPLAISVTALGEVGPRGPLLRSGAMPGDRILVTGSLGGSILGRHLDVQPRVAEALLLHERYDLHAGIDLSDGLSTDLAHVTAESGCGAVIRAADVPIADAARRLSQQPNDPRSPLEHALHDGEDFELLLAAPPGEARRIVADQPLETPVRDIGEFVAERVLQVVQTGGESSPLVVQGFEHHSED